MIDEREREKKKKKKEREREIGTRNDQVVMAVERINYSLLLIFLVFFFFCHFKQEFEIDGPLHVCVSKCTPCLSSNS